MNKSMMTFLCPNCGAENPYDAVYNGKWCCRCHVHVSMLLSSKYQKYFEIADILNFALFGFIVISLAQWWYIGIFILLSITLKHCLTRYLKQTMHCIEAIYITKQGYRKSNVKNYLALSVVCLVLFAVLFYKYS